ncbi:Uncharacterised protein [uncultured archaeon]|nr:Uncharacterised protein [uncultured archaeon]
MKKIIKKLVLAAGLVLAPFAAFSQEDESINYIPSTMETLVNDHGGQGVSLTEMDKTERRARIANSIFLYEGYSDASVSQARTQSFLERYAHNLEDELQDVNSFRFVNNNDYDNPDDLRSFPFEREAYSAFGKTLIEKYKFARDIDRGIRKLRDATTISAESSAGVKYRAGLFIGESDLGAVGVFLKIKNHYFNTVFTVCQNEFETYVEKKIGVVSLRGGYKYETGADGDQKERKIYLSLQSRRF